MPRGCLERILLWTVYTPYFPTSYEYTVCVHLVAFHLFETMTPMSEARRLWNGLGVTGAGVVKASLAGVSQLARSS